MTIDIIIVINDNYLRYWVALFKRVKYVIYIKTVLLFTSMPLKHLYLFELAQNDKLGRTRINKPCFINLERWFET